MGSSVYVDHASDLSYICHHTALTSEDPVKGKEAFEAYAKAHGVSIKHYHADNGRFKDNAFLKSIQENHQTISFSGVGAHHQNGIAEKKKLKDYFKCVARRRVTRQVYHTTPSCEGLGFLNVFNLKLKPKEYEFFIKEVNQVTKDTDL